MREIEGQRDQDGIKISLQKAFVEQKRLVLEKVELQLAEPASQRRQTPGQHERGNRRDYAKPELAGQRLVVGLREFDQRFDVSQTQACLHRDFLTGRGNRNAPVCPVHQLTGEGRLQFLDRVAESRLADKARLGGAAEVLVLDQRQEIPELAERGESGRII
jgi:hypothetical protein